MDSPRDSQIHDFQPTLLGTPVFFQDAGEGMITDENPTEIFIESEYFTGWMLKTEFWAALAAEE
jgi:hypothetical protein